MNYDASYCKKQRHSFEIPNPNPDFIEHIRKYIESRIPFNKREYTVKDPGYGEYRTIYIERSKEYLTNNNLATEFNRFYRYEWAIGNTNDLLDKDKNLSYRLEESYSTGIPFTFEDVTFCPYDWKQWSDGRPCGEFHNLKGQIVFAYKNYST